MWTDSFQVRFDAPEIPTSRASRNLGRVLNEQLVQPVPIVLARVDELEADDLCTLLCQGSAIAGHTPRLGPSDIGVMTSRGGEEDDLGLFARAFFGGLGEDGGDHGQVWQVRSTGDGGVGEEDVAWTKRRSEFGQLVDHGEGHGACDTTYGEIGIRVSTDL